MNTGDEVLGHVCLVVVICVFRRFAKSSEVEMLDLSFSVIRTDDATVIPFLQ